MSSASTATSSTSSDNLILVTNKICPFAHRAWLTLEELGIPYELKETSIAPGTKPEWFTTIYHQALGHDKNSDGKVPVLQDTNFILAESNVISEYLADKYSSIINLLPQTPTERAEYLLFTSQLLDSYIKNFYPLLRCTNNDELIKYTQDLLHVCQNLSQAYQRHNGPYYYGSRISLIDILLWPFIERLCVLQYYRNFIIPNTDEYKYLHTFINTMKQRNAVQRTTMPAEFFIEGYKGYAGSFLPDRSV